MNPTRDRLELLMQIAMLGTWDIRARDQPMIWNARAKELFGMSPDTEVDYDLFLSAIHPDDRSRVHDALEQARLPE